MPLPDYFCAFCRLHDQLFQTFTQAVLVNKNSACRLPKPMCESVVHAMRAIKARKEYDERLLSNVTSYFAGDADIQEGVLHVGPVANP